MPAINGRTALSFSVRHNAREAVLIAAECEQIFLWDIYEFRKAADRALGSSVERIQSRLRGGRSTRRMNDSGS
jgi:hypothetical protein